MACAPQTNAAKNSNLFGISTINDQMHLPDQIQQGDTTRQMDLESEDQSDARTARCVYCGVVAAATEDHIPPKNLFPKPRPSDLVKVDSCRICNTGASKDDEYFRLMLAIRHDAGTTPEGHKLWETIKRSLTRSQAQGLTNSLVIATHQKDVITEGGLFIGTAHAYQVDSERIRRVIARTTRGLYFTHFGRPIPYQDIVRVYADDDLRGHPQLESYLAELITAVTHSEKQCVGDGSVFEYYFKPIADHPTASAWVLSFYRSVFFVALNHPPELK